MKDKLFYIDRRLGLKQANQILDEMEESQEYKTCQRYGYHLKSKRHIDWVLGNGTRLLEKKYPLTLRQMQLDLTNGRAKRYFCYIFYDFA